LTTQEFNHIVRIAGNDIPGENKVIVGISQVKGIGFNLANTILNELNIEPNENMGHLTDSQIQSIESIVKEPSTINLPSWLLNRRKDIDTGNDMHLITSDVDFYIRNDIEREKNTNSWRGYRHTFGLKVRGQRTRCTGRKGGAVGVRKGGKVLPPGVVPGAPGATEEVAPVEGTAKEGTAKEGTAKEGTTKGTKEETKTSTIKKPTSKGESK